MVDYFEPERCCDPRPLPADCTATMACVKEPKCRVCQQRSMEGEPLPLHSTAIGAGFIPPDCVCKLCRNERKSRPAAPATRDHVAEEKVDVGTGSTRSRMDHRYDKVPTEAIQAIAARFALGEVKHTPVGGVDNWKLGQPWRVVWDHMMDHMLKLRDRLESGERFDPVADDDIGAIGWGTAVMCWYERSKQCPPEVREAFYRSSLVKEE